MKSKYDSDGKFLGIEVKALSDLEGGEENLIKGEPYGRLKDLVSWGGWTPYYDQRLAYCEGGCRGDSVRQALINFLGSPIWINLWFEKPAKKFMDF